MLSLVDVSKAYGPKTLFENANLQINAGDRVGLVGPNGAGKSTLFKIILGEESEDTGRVSMAKKADIGFLPQQVAEDYDGSVLELSTRISSEWESLHRMRRETVEARPDVAFEDTDAYGAYQEQWAALDGANVETKAKTVLAGLGFRTADLHRRFRELSGGWRMRVHLGRLLTAEPDLLMLDEPTNHLDLESLLWFQGYLRRYPGGLLVISHDREFLNQLVNQVVDIRHARLNRYVGNYDQYVEQRLAVWEQKKAAYENQQKEIARMQAFIDRFRAKASKASQAQSMIKKLDKLERLPPPEVDEKTITFKFPQPERSGQRTIRLENVRFAYGEKEVYRGDLGLELQRQDRVVLVGPNGAGKSTLLKLMAEVLQPQGGIVDLGHNVRVGYFAQHQTEALDQDKTVLEEATDGEKRIDTSFARSVLGCFLFRGDDVFKKVGVLSGGEKSRLALVKFLLDPPNFLLMDEPTTHLDMPSIDALTTALKQFEGTLAFISHDVGFIRAVATQVYRVDSGRVQKFAGGYDYYLEKSDAVGARQGLTAGVDSGDTAKAKEATKPGISRKEMKRLEAQLRQKWSKERQTKEAVVNGLEKEIEILEAKKQKLTASFEDPQVFEDPKKLRNVQQDVCVVEDQLDSLNSEWEAATEAFEAVQEKANAEVEALRAKHGAD